MPVYFVELRRTASTTASVGNVTADASSPRRGKITEVTFGSEATPADMAFHLRLRRCTTAGTSTAVTPNPRDPNDPATTTDAGENHTVEPTYTSNSEQLSVAIHQRATFRWQAAPKREIVFPATASNGIGMETPVGPAAVVIGTIEFED